jgi:iron complex transport system substrate-binding protein
VLADYRTITDMAGRTVTVPTRVSRVVSISPDATIIVYELNGQDKLVGMALGRIEQTVMPVLEKVYPSSSEIPSVGAFDQANMEQILSLNPDVILAKPFTELDNMSESMGIPAVCITQESVQELKDSYTLIGQVMGKEDEAASILAYFTEKEQYILDRTSQITESARLRVFITGVDPMSTIGGDAYQEYLISTAGGINVASSISGFGTAVSMEQIILWNPDVVLVVSYCKSTAGDISSNAQWQSVKAVKEGSVYDFPTFMGPWDAPGSKSIIGMIWLANILYPDEIGFDINQEIKDYYQTVYRYEISDEEIADILKPR